MACVEQLPSEVFLHVTEPFEVSRCAEMGFGYH